jgi:hypothetical protein
MKLRRLLQKHTDAEAKDGLVQSFGDSYLVANNQIYRRIRQVALQLGYQYSADFDSSYTSLPLSQLDRLIHDKKIPYYDNVSVLRSLDFEAPNQIDWDHICDNLKKNHVFHESCHGVARAIFKELFKEKPTQQTKISLMLLEESFANSCELLSVVDANESVHKIFFESNSYICMFEDRHHLSAALNNFDKKSFFKFILLSYYHANFLNDNLTESDFKKCLSFCFGSTLKLGIKEQKNLRSLAKNAFALNPRFRFATTGFHLRRHGFTQSVEESLSFDHWKSLEANHLVLALDRLSKVVIEGSKTMGQT